MSTGHIISQPLATSYIHTSCYHVVTPYHQPHTIILAQAFWNAIDRLSPSYQTLSSRPAPSNWFKSGLQELFDPDTTRYVPVNYLLAHSNIYARSAQSNWMKKTVRETSALSLLVSLGLILILSHSLFCLTINPLQETVREISDRADSPCSYPILYLFSLTHFRKRLEKSLIDGGLPLLYEAMLEVCRNRCIEVDAEFNTDADSEIDADIVNFPRIPAYTPSTHLTNLSCHISTPTNPHLSSSKRLAAAMFLVLPINLSGQPTLSIYPTIYQLPLTPICRGYMWRCFSFFLSTYLINPLCQSILPHSTRTY